MHEINSVALGGPLDQDLQRTLIRQDGQEDLLFALWHPSVGATRRTGLLGRTITPEPGDREIHGNVSFNASYLQRALTEALQAGAGLAFLHSHPFPGFQYMSDDDISAETRIARAACALTGHPLIGLTTGSDGTWSARSWVASAEQPTPTMMWLPEVRVVGTALRVSRHPMNPPPRRCQDALVRTVSAWGDKAQADLEQARIGVVGLGSVGSIVVESLARMGLGKITLIDFDRVELKNLDRMLTATESDIGDLKTEVAQRRLSAVATTAAPLFRSVPQKISLPAAYAAALDCDVLFSCVDRPHPRHVLNFIAYSHLIPVIDGGMLVRLRDGRFRGADWQVQTVGPGRACLNCLGAYDENSVSLDKDGLLDDPTYIAGLGPHSPLKRRENVFPFSANLASLQVFHLISLLTGIAGQPDLGVQRFRYFPGVLDQQLDRQCVDGCQFQRLVASGDHHFSLMDSVPSMSS